MSLSRILWVLIVFFSVVACYYTVKVVQIRNEQIEKKEDQEKQGENAYIKVLKGDFV
jgi:hypothetical protein